MTTFGCRCSLLTGLLAGAVLFAAPGCGGGGGGTRVSGKVTFEGQPVPGGQITFSPDTRKQNTGNQGVATILRGAYDTSSARNVPSGPVVVRIEGYDKESNNEPGARTIFTYETTLDIPAQGSLTRDFEVTASNAKLVPKSAGPPP